MFDVRSLYLISILCPFAFDGRTHRFAPTGPVFKSRLKVVTLTVFFLHPATGRDKSLHYRVGSKNGHVGQGFSPAEPLSLPLQSSTFLVSPGHRPQSTDYQGFRPPASGTLSSDVRPPNRPLRSRRQGRQEDLFLSNRVAASLNGLTGRLRFDKTFDPAGSQILNMVKSFATFAPLRL